MVPFCVFLFAFTTKSVSYTHLDVYKRQAIDTVDTAEAADNADVVYAQVTNIDGDTIHYEIVEKEYIENYMRCV